MTPSKDPVDAALESLRVHGASPCDSLPHNLEQKLMDADRRSSGRASWLVKSLIAAAILTCGGVVGYAAVEGRWWEGTTFDIGDDGLVTNDEGEVVGETVENEDGTFSTFIQLGNGDGKDISATGIMTTTDEPLTGTSISVGTPAGMEGTVLILDDAAAEKLGAEVEE